MADVTFLWLMIALTILNHSSHNIAFGQCLTCNIACIVSTTRFNNVMENYWCSRIHDNKWPNGKKETLRSILCWFTHHHHHHEKLCQPSSPAFPSFVYFIKVVFYGIVFSITISPIVVGDCFQYTSSIYSHIAIHYY
jgi:hypothetical protein